MVNCQKCGAQIEENDSFCKICGSRVNTSSTGSIIENNEVPQSKNPICLVGFILAFIIPTAGLILSIIGLNRHNLAAKDEKFSKFGIIVACIRFVLTIIYVIYILISSGLIRFLFR
jgi:uncharacterized membrane protein YvbJ